MKVIRQTWLAALLVASLIALPVAKSSAAQVLLDFGILSGAAADWDAIESLVQDTSVPVTDRSGGGDDDVTITAMDDGFNPNNPAPPGVPALYDGITVPVEAVDDYLFKITDTAGTSARLRFDNLDAGSYNITVFEGRTTDANQVAKIWVGDASGSGEPADENTGTFAGGSATVQLDITAGQTLWYRHLEDNSGGISGMIINPVGVPEPSSFVLAALALAGLVFNVVRRRK